MIGNYIYSLFKHKNDKVKNKELYNDIIKLQEELDDLSITDEQKDNIINLFKNWKTSFNRKIFIESLNKSNIRVCDRVKVNNIPYGSSVNIKSTLHFIDCNNVTINILSKVNHITLENCNNINIKTNHGSISGMDCINCSNISHVIKSGNIYYIDISNSTHCNYYISEQVALNTIISTMESMNLLFYF
jgi:hypothetical protein